MAIARRKSGKYISVNALSPYPDREEIVSFLVSNGFKRTTDTSEKPFSTGRCFSLGLPFWWHDGPYNSDPFTHWVEFGNGSYNYIVRTGDAVYDDSHTVKYQRDDRLMRQSETFDTFKELMNDAIKTLGLQ
jgi:hypothetical protein